MDDDAVQSEVLPEVEESSGTDVSSEVASAVDSQINFYDSAGDLVVTSSAVDSVSATVANSSGVYASADTGTYYTLASRVVENTVPVDYLFYRSGQYEYTLLYGDIGVSGTLFSCDSCSYVRWYRDSGNYSYLVETGTTSLSVDTGNFIVYASAPGFPGLDVSTSYETFIIGLCAVSALIIFCIDKMFNYVLRCRNES